jgi:ATP-dependent Clp protease ATP-binding subunit ClpC
MNQYSTKTEEIFGLARKKATELNQDTISSEVLLFAIVEQGDNEGLTLLNKNGANIGKLRTLLSDRFRVIQRDIAVTNPLPKVSNSMRYILNFAKFISITGTIEADALVHSLYRTPDSVASKMLNEVGYTEVGEPKKKVSSDRTSSQNTPALNAFSMDLTILAQENKLDPVIGRESEISRVIEILARRKKNNPALIGEPGVGKTAIVEGLAMRVAAGNVPKMLLNKRILSLDINSIIAGTQYRGQFEQRMQMIIKELMKNPDIILFIDEMHSLMGTGGTEGTGDAANIIKPALSRGYIKCIGATTANEFRKHVEKDGALERRFQKVMIEQPTLEETAQILGQIKYVYELYHGVEIPQEAIPTIIELTERYIQDRFLPDKAIDVLDEAAAVAKLAGTVQVDNDIIRGVVSKTTGVPITNLNKSEREKLKHIDTDLSGRLVGQPDAIQAVSNSIKRKRTGVKSDKRPSTFLFIGPTGVGKTEMARQLARYLFDSEQAMIRLDMSEFFDRFTISSLIGAPPGYIGYDDSGGKLTEKVRKKPYSVVLFDEIEKAHPDVFNVLLQIFDDGILTDSQGRVVSFKNTIIIITSNIGVESAGKRNLGFSETSADDDMKKNLKAALKSFFKPEFLNRLDEIVTFNRLDKDSMRQIMKLMVNDINERFTMSFTPEAEDWFLEKGYSTEYGARPMRRLIEKEVESKMADLLLENPDARSFEVQLVDGKVVVVNK